MLMIVIMSSLPESKSIDFMPHDGNKKNKAVINNNNNYDDLYGAVTQPCRYKGALQKQLRRISPSEQIVILAWL